MKLDHDTDENMPAAYERNSERWDETEPALKRINIKAQPVSHLRQPRIKRHRARNIIGLALVVLLIFVLVRLAASVSATNNQLLVRIGDQGTATLDLNQRSSISPYLLGANVFPNFTTTSVDHVNGFMDYSPTVVNGLRDAHIHLLRFPGGGWGEDHLLSNDQLNSFSSLLIQMGADGMIQARISGSVASSPYNLSSLMDRANLAGRWVDYMNNPRSEQRTGPNAKAPFHPVKFWTVGNEPDVLINPDTRKPFTAADYANTFIQFSLVMHQIDPTIQVFGPEISQFYGVGEGPKDSTGQPWMDTFLKIVGAYEKAHPKLGFHLLDAVSFHSYPLTDAGKEPSILLSSANAWNYQLPALRQLILQDFGRDIPIAVTEINSNPTANVPTPGIAALWWADTLGTLMDQEVAYVAFFSAEGVDTPYPLISSNGLHQTEMLRVLQVFSHLQKNLVPVVIQNNPVSLYATQDDTHQTVSLLFINKSPVTQLAQVSAQNQFLGSSPWHDLNISLSGYSIILVTIQSGGEAVAYSYHVPTIDTSNVGLLNFTVCGKDSNTLSNTVPC